ncbi:unnamed protein product [Owenia fusiformis]|uniref:Chloride channel protein n=1 Tax=Owenia fusiformis TaxID=6347 RepID=A0A8S4NIJ3_OWEFU|nr:unnamed protein product [Owenia fusiformis]
MLGDDIMNMQAMLCVDIMNIQAMLDVYIMSMQTMLDVDNMSMQTMVGVNIMSMLTMLGVDIMSMLAVLDVHIMSMQTMLDVDNMTMQTMLGVDNMSMLTMLGVDIMSMLKLQRKWLARWLVMLMIGIGTALVATIIEICIEYITEYKFLALKKLFDFCRTYSCLAVPLLAWVAFNALVVAAGSALVTYVAPQAAGSGIPQIKCYLNGVKIPGLLSIKTLAAKMFGVILSVGGGLACGKEGPMIHSGSIVAAGISQGRSKLCNKDFKVFEYFRSDNERRDFVSGGAAAGVSAAFGAPIGGVLFTLEEGASFWNQSLTWRIVFASMLATFAVNLLLSAVHGHPSDLSNPGLISFGRFPDISYQAIELPIFLLMGVVGGFSGAFFNAINYRLTVFRHKYICPKRWLMVLEAMLVAAISALLGFVMIFFVHDCRDNLDDEHYETRIQVFCPDGQYNAMGDIFFKSPEASLVSMLHEPADAFQATTLITLVIPYFLLACWTYGLSVSSGVFIPSLLIGAVWGRLIGLGFLQIVPSMGNNIGKYALIGAACQLGGTVRMTISLTVILVECTGDIKFGLPIMLCLMLAKWVGDFFNKGLYDMHIYMMGIPILPWDAPEMSYTVFASEIMNSPSTCLHQVETAKRIVEVLREHPHQGYPVIEPCEGSQEIMGDKAYGRCKGLILNSQLGVLLKHKVFDQVSPKPVLDISHFRDVHTSYTMINSSGKRKNDIQLTDEEMKYTIDLTPYMNPAPYQVTQHASLPRIFRLFRGLGLRHLLVVNEKHEVAGMITRKDLAKYRETQQGGSVRMRELSIQEY